MLCRCNMCMELFCDEAIVEVPGRNGEIIEKCPVCGRSDYIMDLGGYAFELCNGDIGEVEWFMTLDEAIMTAEGIWSRLTLGERAKYTDRTCGGTFRVYDSDGHTCRDWGAELRAAIKRNRGRF